MSSKSFGMTVKEVSEFKSLLLESEKNLYSEIGKFVNSCNDITNTSFISKIKGQYIQELSASLVGAYEYFDGCINIYKTNFSINHDPITSFCDTLIGHFESYNISPFSFLKIIKGYKNAYFSILSQAAELNQYKTFTGSFFDHLELKILSHWNIVSENELSTLEERNKEIISEKNKYLSLFQSFFIPIILLDNTNNVTDFNQASASLFQFLEVNKPLDHYQNDKDYDFSIVSEQLKELYKSNIEHKKNFETCLKTSKGERFFEVTIKVMHVNNLFFKGTLIMLDDLTNRKEIEKHLEIAKTRAEEADKLKTSFLANMSHEIRTPMNAILGFTELLLTGQIATSDRNEYLRLIQKSGNDLLHIIEDIIDIAKIETKQLKIKEKSCKLYGLMSDLQRLYKEIMSRKAKTDVELLLHVEPDEKDLTIITDEERLKQVLSNLINNALKFTDEGFIEFGYKVAQEQKIYFYVKDTGVGIPNVMQDKIFERFMQVDDTYSKNPGGTGLGLTICKNIVQLLGGDIWVMSTVGEGSNFYFYLPMKTEFKEEKKVKEKKDFKEHIQYNWKDYKILIAEDEATNYLYLKEILKRTGINILWAKTGLDAINLTESVEDINLILMDIKMPELNGLEAAKYILKIRPDIPIIAQTAFAMEDDKELCLKIGFKEYMTKPIHKGKLLLVLNKYLRKKEIKKVTY